MFRKSELGLQNSCWLKSARYDLVFLVLSPLFGFLWLVLFYIKGMEALLPAYFVQIVMTGTPHLLLTLYLLSDFQSQEKLKSSGFIFGLALSAAAISTVVIYI